MVANPSNNIVSRSTDVYYLSSEVSLQGEKAQETAKQKGASSLSKANSEGKASSSFDRPELPPAEGKNQTFLAGFAEAYGKLKKIQAESLVGQNNDLVKLDTLGDTLIQSVKMLTALTVKKETKELEHRKASHKAKKKGNWFKQSFGVAFSNLGDDWGAFSSFIHLGQIESTFTMVSKDTFNYTQKYGKKVATFVGGKYGGELWDLPFTEVKKIVDLSVYLVEAPILVLYYNSKNIATGNFKALGTDNYAFGKFIATEYIPHKAEDKFYKQPRNAGQSVVSHSTADADKLNGFEKEKTETNHANTKKTHQKNEQDKSDSSKTKVSGSGVLDIILQAYNGQSSEYMQVSHGLANSA